MAQPEESREQERLDAFGRALESLKADVAKNDAAFQAALKQLNLTEDELRAMPEPELPPAMKATLEKMQAEAERTGRENAQRAKQELGITDRPSAGRRSNASRAWV
jgi:4'-phosphopantetheinyl transferase EntD